MVVEKGKEASGTRKHNLGRERESKAGKVGVSSRCLGPHEARS